MKASTFALALLVLSCAIMKAYGSGKKIFLLYVYFSVRFPRNSLSFNTSWFFIVLRITQSKSPYVINAFKANGPITVSLVLTLPFFGQMIVVAVTPWMPSVLLVLPNKPSLTTVLSIQLKLVVKLEVYRVLNWEVWEYFFFEVLTKAKILWQC